METLLQHLPSCFIKKVAIIVTFWLVHGVSYSQKTLIITEIMSVPDVAGEWFE